MDNQPIATAPAAKTAPSALTFTTLGFLLLGFVFFKFIMLAVLPQPAVQASDLVVENIMTSVNRERQLRNLITLNTDARLSSAAQSKANDMQARHYFSHTDPEGKYIWPAIEAAGYTPYLQLGENLAIEFTNTDSLVSAWMNSPTHRANILNDGFKDQGIGLDFGDVNAGQYYSAVANTFGTLMVAHKQTTTATTPPPAPTTTTTKKPTATTKPKTTTTAKPAPVVSKPTSSPSAATAPTTTQPLRQPLAIRGEETEQPSFTTPLHVTSAPASSASSSKPTAGSPFILSEAATGFDMNKYQRFFALGAGLLLLIVLLLDLRTSLQRQMEKLDKKASNLTLLVLAIIVVVLMYWL